MAQDKDRVLLATNKKARFQYFLVDRYKAGMVLTGTEVKSARIGRVSLNDAYCVFKDGELWIKNMHIAEYKFGNLNNHEPRRKRKLLLQKRELKRLEAKVKEKGLTIIPVELFINERGYIKLEISLAKGKKAFNKKESIKQKDLKRDLERSMREYR